MRVIGEIMSYNDILKDVEELYEKMNLITNKANARICQTTGLSPILVFSKEKEHLQTLLHDKVCSLCKNVTISVKVNATALFNYKQNKYSVQPELIGKTIFAEVNENNLYVYYSKKLITVDRISNKVNYHIELMGVTFKRKEIETVQEYANKHLKELEKFNEQLSKLM